MSVAVAKRASDQSIIERLKALPLPARRRIIAGLSAKDRERLTHDWKAWRRPKQDPRWDDPWFIWLLMTGRGFGKTRTGAEAVNEAVWERGVKRIVLMGNTEDETIRIMVKGQSGLLNIGPPEQRPEFHKNDLELVWPNGATALVCSSETPDKVRGPEFEMGWVDELASFSNLQDELNSPWENLKMAVRLGDDPRIIVTSTPRRLQLLRDLIKEETTRLTEGSTYENISNLSKRYIDNTIKPKEGTRLAQQEIHGKILPDEEGSLWKSKDVEKTRIANSTKKLIESMERMVITVDPATTATDESDKTGICAAGAAGTEAYIFRSLGLNTSPNGWASAACRLYDEFEADYIIAEANNGGDMVKTVIKGIRPDIPVRIIKASRGKQIRAEPVSEMYENHRVHHVGVFEELEMDMYRFPKDHEYDDEIDAMVYAVTDLLVRKPVGWSRPKGKERAA